MEKKLEDLKGLLDGAEKIAAELLRDERQGASPHAGPLRSRCVAAKESLEAHGVWLTTNPIEAPETKAKAKAPKAE